MTLPTRVQRNVFDPFEAAQRELAEKSTELECSRSELQAVKNSSSWKLTAPVRALVSRLRLSGLFTNADVRQQHLQDARRLARRRDAVRTFVG